MAYSPSQVLEEFKLDDGTMREVLHELPKDKLASMLEKMFLTRYFEENAEALYARGLVHGTIHLSIGMEASPIGSIAAEGRVSSTTSRTCSKTRTCSYRSQSSDG